MLELFIRLYSQTKELILANQAIPNWSNTDGQVLSRRCSIWLFRRRYIPRIVVSVQHDEHGGTHDQWASAQHNRCRLKLVLRQLDTTNRLLRFAGFCLFVLFYLALELLHPLPKLSTFVTKQLGVGQLTHFACRKFVYILFRLAFRKSYNSKSRSYSTTSGTISNDDSKQLK